jgi:anti-anti-sigma regulatory factor
MTLIIQRAVKGDDATFTLSGRLNGEEVAELQRLFATEGKDHGIVLDLKEVGLVNLDAVRFLAHCEGNGVKLKNCPAYIRVWIMREVS